MPPIEPACQANVASTALIDSAACPDGEAAPAAESDAAGAVLVVSTGVD